MGNVDVPFAAVPPSDERIMGAGAPGQDEPFLLENELTPAFDLRAIWSTIYRNRLVMLGIVIGAILLGIVSILVMPRVYQARASVQIDQQVAKVLGTEDADPVVSGVEADRFLQTQVDVLNSRAMAKRVSDSLGLAANDNFLKQMSGTTGLLAVDPAAGTRLERVLDTLQKNLTVDLPRNSRVVGIVFRSRDPALAAQIANSYSTNFIEGNIQRKFSTSAYSRRFLTEQLGLVKARLEASERALIAYARSARLIDASAGAPRQVGAAAGPRSLVTANLVDLNSAFAESEANRLRAEQRWEQARATPLMALPDVLTNEAVQRLTQKQAESIASLNELRHRLKPDHPTVIQAVAELNALENQTRLIAENVRNSIKNQYLTAERQHRAIAQEVASLKNATLSEQDRGVQYNILQREVDTNRQLYESMLQRFKEVSAQAGITTNNVAIVDTAEAPRRPTSPRPLLNLLLSVIAGFALALLYVFGRDYLDDAIRDPLDVEEKLNLPLLGVVPEHPRGAPLEALSDPKSDIAEAYHSIRTSIELSSNRGVPRSILVTGGGKSEGKSTTSYALAMDFAALGKRVVLIDADLRRPSLHRLIRNRQTDKGLSTVLAKLNPIAAALVTTEHPNLMFMPSGPLPPDPAMLFAGSALADLLSQLARDCDIVMIDGPPVLALADATQLAAAAQATIFVVEAGGAHLGQARNAVMRLSRAGANIIGSVVTKYNARKLGYGDSYNYYRYRYDEARPAR
ncbi:N/A [soil metagenome]